TRDVPREEIARAFVWDRSADHIRASSHNGCIQRPNTWLHPNASQNVRFASCTAGAVHTWHIADISAACANVRNRGVVSRGRGNTLSQTQGMEWTAMDRSYARGFNAVAKEELWERWQRGQSLKAIGRAFGKPSSSIYFQVAPHGGIRPARRRRSRLA